MNKIWQIGIIVIGVIIVILFLTAIMQVFTEVTETANASANLTPYPGSEAALISAPWYLYFVPVIIGLFAIVGILRGGTTK